MTKERAEKVADFVWGLLWCASAYRMSDEQRVTLAALLADEPEPEPEKPPEPVYRTAEYLAAALVVRACPPEQVSEGARLFDDFLSMVRRYKPEVK